MSNCDLIGKGQLFDGFGSFDGRRKYQSHDSLQSVNDLPPVATGNEQVATNVRGHEDSMSVCSNSSSNDDKDAFQLNMTVRELVDTERIYVKDLHDVVFGYLQNIDRIGILNRQQHKHLFGNIRSIYEFNRKFLGYLEKNMADPVQVSSCFVDFNNEFVIYSDYCTNYPRSVKVLEDLMKDANFVTIVKNEQTKLQHPLPLGTYLFKPVQRILKYHLLLKSMQAYHSADAVGHDVIELAVDRMVAIAMFINEMKRRHEMLLRTQELQNLLTGSQFRTDLNSYGDLVLEDTFRLTGVWGERYILLFSKALIMTKKRKDGTLQVKIIIKTSDIMLIESISREPLQFHILAFESPKVRYALQAKTVEQKQLWCQEIKKLMMDNFPANIPERAKQVVLGSAGATRESSYTQDKPSKKPAFVRRNYKSMTPEVRSEHRTRRRSTGTLSKNRDADDDVSLKGATVDSKNAVLAASEVEASDERCEEPIEAEFEPEEDDIGDDYDTESKEEIQTPSLTENKSVLSSPMKNRRSQSLDSICEAAKAEPTLDETSEIESFSGQFITDNETSAESDNEEAKPDDYSEVIQPKPMLQPSSVRIIPIRADSFRQAIQMDPVEGKTKRTSTLEDVFEDVVSCPGQTSSGVIESPTGVVMRRSSSRSVTSPTLRTSSIAETMESRKKRFSRMFDDWDKTVLDSISTVSDLFKSWPMFDEFSDPSVSSYQTNLKLANRANQLYSGSSSSSSGDRSTDRVIPIHVETTPLAPMASNVQQTANSRPSYSIPIVVQSTASSTAQNSSSDVVLPNTTAAVTTSAVNTAISSKSSSSQSVSIPVIVNSSPVVTHHTPMGPLLQKSVTDGRYSQPNFNMPLIVKPTVSIPVLVKTCHSPTGVGKTVPVLTTSDNQPFALGQSSSLFSSRSDGGVVKHVQVTSGHSVPILVHCENKPTMPGHYVPIMVKSGSQQPAGSVQTVPLTAYKSDCSRTPASSHSIPVTVKCSPSSKDTIDNKPECEQPGQGGGRFVNSVVSAGDEVNNQPPTSSSLCCSTSERYPSQQLVDCNNSLTTSATTSSDNVNCQQQQLLNHQSADASKSVAVNALDNNCNCDLTCNDSNDDDPLKKMLEEMTVKHQTVRETVRKINNVKPSRSMDVLDSGHVHVLHSESDCNSCDVVKSSPPPSGGSLLCAPLNKQQPPSPGITASELIRQRVHMFEHDLNS